MRLARGKRLRGSAVTTHLTSSSRPLFELNYFTLFGRLQAWVDKSVALKNSTGSTLASALWTLQMESAPQHHKKFGTHLGVLCFCKQSITWFDQEEISKFNSWERPFHYQFEMQYTAWLQRCYILPGVAQHISNELLPLGVYNDISIQEPESIFEFEWTGVGQ